MMRVVSYLEEVCFEVCLCSGSAYLGSSRELYLGS